MDYLKNEIWKLAPVSLLIIIISFPHWKIGIIGLGLFLLYEHRLTYSRWDIKDILGHETLGIVLLITGLLLSDMGLQAVFCLLIYFIFGKWKWEVGIPPLQYARKKLNYGG